MLRQTLMPNIWGILGTIALNVLIYFMLLYLLKKTNIPNNLRLIIIIGIIIIITIVSYLSGFLTYEKISVEIANSQGTYIGYS